MTTRTFLSPLDHSTDAGFRAWGGGLSAELQAAGLVKTADTGQVDWTTALRPASQVYVYEIYYLNDSLHATNPVFLKIEYGSNASTAIPGLRISVGQGSNGAGALTGVVSEALICTKQTSPSSTTASFSTNICVTNGFFGLEFKREAVNTVRSYGLFWVCRSVDGAGALTGDNVFVSWGNNAGSDSTNTYVFGQVLAPPAGTVYPKFGGFLLSGGTWSYIPGGVSSSLVGTSPQAYRLYAHTPRVRPVFGVLSMLATEYALDTIFTTIPVGSTVPHTYKVINATHSAAGPATTTASYWAILWE